ncbi:hypothetical protein [Guyparkeria sp. SCN-R1]|uniref:hypothetical protein n=1 Tax=Guyparkeria sp. SCN-R1 TaxID=2341113 RepID=UPI000F64E0A4|nr:hypothetical protein [Guyparkeria sp. SCN-R1]
MGVHQDRRAAYSPAADRLLLDQLERVSQDDPDALRLVRERRARLPMLIEIHRRRGTLIGESPPPTVGETMDLFDGKLGPSTLFEALAELALALDAEAVTDPPADERSDGPTPDRV